MRGAPPGQEKYAMKREKKMYRKQTKNVMKRDKKTLVKIYYTLPLPAKRNIMCYFLTEIHGSRTTSTHASCSSKKSSSPVTTHKNKQFDARFDVFLFFFLMFLNSAGHSP